MTAPSPAPDQRSLGPLLQATLPYARPSVRRAAWQLAATLAALAALLFALRLGAGSSWVLLGVLPVAGLVIRAFVLQHDCGHQSFLPGSALNHAAGRALSLITGIPYDAWRAKHNWHHQHHGDLAQRTYDPMTPMTAEEARQAPEKARERAKRISFLAVFVFGGWDILFNHKRRRGFFMLRPGYPHPVPQRAAMVRGIRATVLGHLAFHAALFALVGPWSYLGAVLPGYLVAGGIGTTLFWVQHNFDSSYYARPEVWDFARVSLAGSSYLRLPAPLAWFTASIGLHHVHHLNPRIANYRLEAARRGLPELSAVPPLGWAAFRSAYTHVFWDDDAGRMVPLEEALGQEREAGLTADAARLLS